MHRWTNILFMYIFLNMLTEAGQSDEKIDSDILFLLPFWATHNLGQNLAEQQSIFQKEQKHYLNQIKEYWTCLNLNTPREMFLVKSLSFMQTAFRYPYTVSIFQHDIVCRELCVCGVNYFGCFQKIHSPLWWTTLSLHIRMLPLCSFKIPESLVFGSSKVNVGESSLLQQPHTPPTHTSTTHTGVLSKKRDTKQRTQKCIDPIYISNTDALILCIYYIFDIIFHPDTV